MVLFIAEALILCALFALAVVTIALKTDPVSWVYNYPQPIVDRAIALGLTTKEKGERNARVVLKKGLAMVLFGILLGLLVTFVNGARDFWQGFLLAFGLWVIVDWFDVALDILWFCHEPRCVIPGTEDLTDAYHDYGFHVRASLRGMIWGLPMALISGALTALIRGM